MPVGGHARTRVQIARGARLQVAEAGGNGGGVERTARLDTVTVARIVAEMLTVSPLTYQSFWLFGTNGLRPIVVVGAVVSAL